MKILGISDVELNFIYSPSIAQRFGDVDFVVSCGDLPYYYIEYVISTLNVPLYYVRGNHASQVEYTTGGVRSAPWGGVDIHGRCATTPGGVLLAGIQGSLQYNYGPYQYSQAEMWLHVFRLVPGMLINRLRYGRYLDILVTHAPPWKIHDHDDRPHQGIKAFRWLLEVFHPVYHLHGHIHVYRSDTVIETLYRDTQVVNVFGYREMGLTPARTPAAQPARRVRWEAGKE
ncbi:MAG: hypothetical protein GYA17_05850 [Chloroflexi bacterium]|nr:metallophosphoesterase [Anaerolineaceae bacterium]NMB87861.1 hypothetical protein [Chloroflexota bacterium]